MFAQEQRLVLMLDALGNHPQPMLCARATIARAIAASSTAPGRPATKPWSIFSLCTGSRLRRISEE